MVEKASGIGDEIFVEGQYATPGADIEAITFTKGETITKAELDALQVGVVGGTANADELYGTSGADILRGHAGDDYLDGGPTPERRTLDDISVLDQDQLDDGTGADTYALYWGMGSDTIIDAADGQTSTPKLINGATMESVKTSREGDDLLVTMRGSTEGARVKDLVESGAADWQIASDTEGSQSGKVRLRQDRRAKCMHRGRMTCYRMASHFVELNNIIAGGL